MDEIMTKEMLSVTVTALPLDWYREGWEGSVRRVPTHIGLR